MKVKTKMITVFDGQKESIELYIVTIENIAQLVRDFQADQRDGFVSNDNQYIENWLTKTCHE